MKKIFIILMILLLPIFVNANNNSQEINQLEYSSGKIDLTNGTKIIILPNSTEKTQNELTENDLLDFKIINYANYYKVEKEKLIKTLSKKLDIKVSENHTLRILKYKYNLSIEEINEISNKIKDSETIKYHPIEILVIISILYFASWLLTKKKKTSKANHRKFWNLLLLISFFVCATLGFLTTTQIALGWPKLNIRGLHVDPGIVFSIIGVFHTFWHIPYLKRILKFK